MRIESDDEWLADAEGTSDDSDEHDYVDGEVT